MIDPHIQRIRARHSLSREEEEAIRAVMPPPIKVKRHAMAVRHGDKLDVSTLLISGLMGRYKDLPNGRRQFAQLHVAGDFIDLHAFTLKRLEHNIMALSDCTVVTVPHERLRTLLSDHPRIGMLYWFSTNLDACINREWELSLGQRSAAGRVAALFCEMHVRVTQIGDPGALDFPLPMNQSELAECVGMTPVHVNRTLRQLREDGIATFERGRVTIMDLDRLHKTAQFDPSFLYLDAIPL
ncbi:MAG: Crp/Fnr family transcriptional regulator [Sphingobium sp.]